MQQQLQMAQHNRQIIQQMQQQQRILLSGGQLQIGSGMSINHQASHLPLVNSPSSGNILHVSD